MRRSPSSFSSRSGFGPAGVVVAEPDRADRVGKTQTETRIAAIAANVVLSELEPMAHLLSWVARLIVQLVNMKIH